MDERRGVDSYWRFSCGASLPRPPLFSAGIITMVPHIFSLYNSIPHTKFRVNLTPTSFFFIKRKKIKTCFTFYAIIRTYYGPNNNLAANSNSIHHKTLAKIMFVKINPTNSSLWFHHPTHFIYISPSFSHQLHPLYDVNVITTTYTF